MPTTKQTTWMTPVLQLAAIYNIVWGAFVVLFPLAPFQWANMALPTYPQLWQCIGMIVGVYGVGYALASRDPLRHWPIVLVGLLGKILGPIGFLHAAWAGNLPWVAGWTLLTNDLVWWIPFALILYRAYHNDTPSSPVPINTTKTLETAITQTGESLTHLSNRYPLLVVFLRHFGCTFCREALADISAKRADIESQGTHIVLVHMDTDDAEAARVFSQYGLEDIDRISDPDRVLYQTFGLKRGNMRQLFGFKVWWRGFKAGILNKHGVGWAKTDSFQMPGVFLFDQGQIVQSFRHNSAADRPDYESLAMCEAANTRMKKDLDMAAQVQQALLPKSQPNIEGVSFAWTLNPSDELAGDTLDFIPLDDDHIGFYVLDVSGHGVSSALLTVTLHHWLSPQLSRSRIFKRRYTNGKHRISSPAHVAAKLNQQFPQNLETGQYFTFIYGILHTKTYLFRYVTAGHPAPFHLSNNVTAQLQATGPPIGILPDFHFQDNEVQLNPGDRLYLFTDGLTEMQNQEEEEFGAKQVIAQIEQDKTVPLDQSLSNLVTGARSWGKDSIYTDDIAILSLEIANKAVAHQTPVTPQNTTVLPKSC